MTVTTATAKKSAATPPAPPTPNFEAERHAATMACETREDACPPETSSTRQFSDLKPAFHGSLLCGLFERAADKLSDSELISLVGLASEGNDCLRRIADLAESIGCLTSHDETVGSFRDGSSVANLLFVISDQARQGEARMDLADRAETELIQRTLRRTGQFPDPLSVYRDASEGSISDVAGGNHA